MIIDDECLKFNELKVNTICRYEILHAYEADFDATLIIKGVSGASVCVDYDAKCKVTDIIDNNFLIVNNRTFTKHKRLVFVEIINN